MEEEVRGKIETFIAGQAGAVAVRISKMRLLPGGAIQENWAADIEITHLNLNDNTLEGFKHLKLPLFSVQYHPEASPGPHDARYLFDEFTQLMERK